MTTTEPGYAETGGWGAERMNELEALMWRSERHPWASSHVMAVFVLDLVPEWDRLYAAHEWAVQRVPRIRDRVLDPLLPVGTPAWVPDDHFSLDYHLRRAHLPAPGGMAELLHLAQTVAMTPFDRTRPLWEGVLVDGLEDGRGAYILKLHHSLADGMGSIQLISLVQSRTRKHTPDKPVAPPRDTVPPADGLRLARDEVAEQARQVPSALLGLLNGGARAASRPGASASAALRFAASLRRTLSPPPAGPSPLFRNRTGRSWRFGVFDCPLADLKGAARAAGGSVNDAYVAVLLGGMRRYHEHFGVELEELPMALPLSLRKADDPMGGNRFAGALFPGPVGIGDPAERIAAIRGTILSLRVEPALDSFSVVAPVLNRLPSVLGATAMNRLGAVADMSASNIPGLAHSTYLAGARVERLFPFGPLPGVAVMAAMVSHDGTCCFGLNMDESAVAEPELLIGCMREGVDEVLALAPRSS